MNQYQCNKYVAKQFLIEMMPFKNQLMNSDYSGRKVSRSLRTTAINHAPYDQGPEAYLNWLSK